MEATTLSPVLEQERVVNPAPTSKQERLLFLDSVRGIALLGILIMNILAQSQPHHYYLVLNPDQPTTGPNLWVWAAEALLFEGTMRGLFSILFGAGTLLFLNRLNQQKAGLEPADLYYRRMLWLLAFGLINAYFFLWPGDILYPYALCGLLLFPFRNWSARNLLFGALFLLAIGTYRENSMLYENKTIIKEGKAAERLEAQKVKLTPAQEEALGKWKGFKEKNSSQGINEEAKKELQKVQDKSYLDIFRYYRDINMMLQGTKFYMSRWWDILLFFFLGMALFKSGFLMGRQRTALYLALAVAGISAGVLLNYYLHKTNYNLGFDGVAFAERWKFSYYEIRRVVQTVGYLSLLVLLYKAVTTRRVLHFFAPVGQMAFTNYLMQSIITSIFFYGFAFYGKLQRYEVYLVMLCIWTFQIAFSHIWLRFYRFGPFEWAWRSLTYWQKQPMKKGPHQEHQPLSLLG